MAAPNHSNPPWWQVHLPVLSGIVALTLVVWFLRGTLPSFLVQVLWPMAFVVPASSSYLRARRQNWSGRYRRGAIVDLILALLIAGAMLTFQLGRDVDEPLQRYQINAALVLAMGQPSWLVWSLYDSLMLFLQERRS